MGAGLAGNRELSCARSPAASSAATGGGKGLWRWRGRARIWSASRLRRAGWATVPASTIAALGNRAVAHFPDVRNFFHGLAGGGGAVDQESETRRKERDIPYDCGRPVANGARIWFLSGCDVRRERAPLTWTARSLTIAEPGLHRYVSIRGFHHEEQSRRALQFG